MTKPQADHTKRPGGFFRRLFGSSKASSYNLRDSDHPAVASPPPSTTSLPRADPMSPAKSKHTNSPAVHLEPVSPFDTKFAKMSPAPQLHSAGVASESDNKPVSPCSSDTESLTPNMKNDAADWPAAVITPTSSVSSSPKSPPEKLDAAAQAFSLYCGTATFVPEEEYASWLGADYENRHEVRVQYMALFSMRSTSILSALRRLCDKLYMRAESQHLHRIIEAFSQTWVSQNPSHGLYDSNVVYTIAYALVLLNTDLYAAEHTAGKKMSKSVFVQNTLDTIRSLTAESRKAVIAAGPRKSVSNDDVLGSAPGARRSSTSLLFSGDTLALVTDCPMTPLSREWESQLENILKAFYGSVAKEPLKLHLSESGTPLSRTYSPSNSLSAAPSIMSASGILNNQSATASSIFGRFGRSRNSSKAFDYERHDSLGSTFSIDSTISHAFGGPRHAVGFAGVLWNSMIKEEDTSTAQAEDDDFADFSKIEKELAEEMELELQGAPWAKEGLLQYRPYVDPVTGKKPKKKEWTKVFMVVQRGQLKMFRFDTSSTSSRSNTSGTIGAGNWMENAQQLGSYHLCHTMAQELPAAKKMGGFSAVWSLALPQKGLLVFQAGTIEVAREFVYTCNYWAARLSKEPFNDPVSNMEFGWGAPLDDGTFGTQLSTVASSATLRRTQNRMLPGDRLNIKEWRPSGHNMVVSDLNEQVQVKSLREYIERAENDLGEHNALRSRMAQVFSPSSTNWHKAQTNWERKSQYLLQQVIRYKTYTEVLDQAIKDKEQKLKPTETAETAETVADAERAEEESDASAHTADETNNTTDEL